MKIEILYFPECPHTQAAVAEVERALSETGIQAEIHQTSFSEETARTRGFAGSPTILVNGKDVEESVGGNANGLSCRLYGGGHFVPAQESIQKALREAHVRERG